MPSPRVIWKMEIICSWRKILHPYLNFIAIIQIEFKSVRKWWKERKQTFGERRKNLISQSIRRLLKSLIMRWKCKIFIVWKLLMHFPNVFWTSFHNFMIFTFLSIHERCFNFEYVIFRMSFLYCWHSFKFMLCILCQIFQHHHTSHLAKQRAFVLNCKFKIAWNHEIHSRLLIEKINHKMFDENNFNIKVQQSYLESIIKCMR